MLLINFTKHICQPRMFCLRIWIYIRTFLLTNGYYYGLIFFSFSFKDLIKPSCNQYRTYKQTRKLYYFHKFLLFKMWSVTVWIVNNPLYDPPDRILRQEQYHNIESVPDNPNCCSNERFLWCTWDSPRDYLGRVAEIQRFWTVLRCCLQQKETFGTVYSFGIRQLCFQLWDDIIQWRPMFQMCTFGMERSTWCEISESYPHLSVFEG